MDIGLPRALTSVLLLRAGVEWNPGMCDETAEAFETYGVDSDGELIDDTVIAQFDDWGGLYYEDHEDLPGMDELDVMKIGPLELIASVTRVLRGDSVSDEYLPHLRHIVDLMTNKMEKRAMKKNPSAATVRFTTLEPHIDNLMFLAVNIRSMPQYILDDLTTFLEQWTALDLDEAKAAGIYIDQCASSFERLCPFVWAPWRIFVAWTLPARAFFDGKSLRHVSFVDALAIDDDITPDTEYDTECAPDTEHEPDTEREPSEAACPLLSEPLDTMKHDDESEPLPLPHMKKRRGGRRGRKTM